MLRFSRLQVSDWRQFSNVDISLDSRVTVITGRNASGKTTLLRLLDQHFSIVRHDQFVSTPVMTESGLSYSSDSRWTHKGTGIDYVNDIPIGAVTFSDNTTSDLTIPRKPGSWYQVTSRGNQRVIGFPIHANRGSSYYPKVDQISIVPLVPEEMFEKTTADLLQFPPSQTDPLHGLHITRKRHLLNSFFNGVYRTGNRSGEIVGAFQEAMKALLPEEIGFDRFETVESEIIMVTKYGSFSMDSMSGGIALIADIAWLIISTCWKYDNIVVTIDEPENHMHPGLQQVLLPRLVEFFTQPIFIVATHSPLVVTSVRDANVFALSRDSKGLIESRRIEDLQTRGTANETLRDVLGLSYTKPVWASKKLNEIVEKYTRFDATAEHLAAMRAELKDAGLAEYALDTAARLIFREDGEEPL